MGPSSASVWMFGIHAPTENITRKQRLNFYTEKPTDDPANPEKIFVYFSDEKNVSIKTMRK